MNPGSLGVLIPIIGMMIGFFVVFSRSDLGRALAQRISGAAGASPASDGELRELRVERVEVDALRAELSETQERLDFTERMLAAGKQEG